MRYCGILASVQAHSWVLLQWAELEREIAGVGCCDEPLEGHTLAGRVSRYVGACGVLHPGSLAPGHAEYVVVVGAVCDGLPGITTHAGLLCDTPCLKAPVRGYIWQQAVNSREYRACQQPKNCAC